ncbi:hypothetical protein CC1G_00127 [Coprinopsis cinerea okayama7|uniref:Uncharacterized protein n=1 Tax=Coprinopsis cinerea (strain Okayama-7 / 130 / ATCC MYA-4618 / FGSC 9003) TaxID=240176 RepID=A8NWV0_COPC7|nr:hypothetical protein CC1G_00127 [Coprinopsis cinerea okayama7\|eukprot:XP_001836991.1 hypothetical protein CC1G_00127 [Coprinopsis cinerea okayama7\
MFASLARASAPSVAESIQRLLPKQLPPSLSPKSGNLYEVLSRTPTGGVGKKVYQTRWRQKDIKDSYWVVTRSKFKCDGQHGKAWGVLYWKGKQVSPKEEVIRGGLKYSWKEGSS